MQVPRDQKFLESANGLHHLSTAQATNDADVSKLLHGAPAGLMHVKNAIMGEGVGCGKWGTAHAGAGTRFELSE
jgi:hypothetical protein